MAERMLITKLVRTDQTRADLYGKGHQYKDLTLFDLGDLAAVGLEPASLPIGQEVPCRFWAHYTLSDKLNKAGNPYKDIVALEAIDRPATSTSTDNSALLAELRAIRALLQVIAEAQGLEIPAVAGVEPDGNGSGPSELDQVFPRYGDGSTLAGDNPSERAAYDAYLQVEGQAPQDVTELRAWYAAHQNAGAKQNGTE